MFGICVNKSSIFTKVFRGTPHYPQRAKSSILTILTSHCKTTLQSHTAKPSGTAAQFHSTFRSGNPDNPTSIVSHITVSSYTAALSQCHFRSIIQSIPHTLQHQEISTFRSVTHALVVSQQTHAVMFRLLLLYTESCKIQRGFLQLLSISIYIFYHKLFQIFLKNCFKLFISSQKFILFFVFNFSSQCTNKIISNARKRFSLYSIRISVI